MPGFGSARIYTLFLDETCHRERDSRQLSREMKSTVVLLSLAVANLASAQVFSPTETFPPDNAMLRGKLVGGLSHGTERWTEVDFSNFSSQAQLSKGWDGTIKGVASAGMFTPGAPSQQGKASYSLSLQFQGSDSVTDSWNVLDSDIFLSSSAGAALEKFHVRQEFGPVQAQKRNSSLFHPNVPDFEISASLVADAYESLDGGLTYNPTGDTFHFDLTPTPEPASILIIGSGVFGILAGRRRVSRSL